MEAMAHPGRVKHRSNTTKTVTKKTKVYWLKVSLALQVVLRVEVLGLSLLRELLEDKETQMSFEKG